MSLPNELRDRYTQYPTLKAFADYMESLITGSAQGIPYKADIHPYHMKPFLSSIVLYEILSADHVKLRLVGTAAEAIFGERSTGTNVLEILPQESHKLVSWFFMEVSEKRCATWQDEELVLDNGRLIEAVTLGFPLLCKEGKPRFRISSTFLSNTSWVAEPVEDRAQVTHRSINMVGYYDLGFGVPDRESAGETMPQKVSPKYREGA
ncbi:PAS domain-containing protein [Kordiimonas sp. SCSIO 12603]|uniref:hypothetical protein n=1 Tax=Kordiimonas sp. SCSIO 12603 TaxID=2829596 RepID=UPI002106A24A|nr:hypothetical protein [Kordiimonas sp. SCSIO 12603]UTW59002.1 PAS domain-containing protein [Kordiimonas sp. SCSIO 12603]